MLNKIYTRWDELVDEYKLFKVESVNQTYTVAAGLSFIKFDPTKEEPNCVRLAFYLLFVAISTKKKKNTQTSHKHKHKPHTCTLCARRV